MGSIWRFRPFSALPRRSYPLLCFYLMRCVHGHRSRAASEHENERAGSKRPEDCKNTPKNTVFCDFAAVFRLLLLAFALLFLSRDVPWSHGYRFSVITGITEAIDRNIPFFSFL